MKFDGRTPYCSQIVSSSPMAFFIFPPSAFTRASPSYPPRLISLMVSMSTIYPFRPISP